MTDMTEEKKIKGNFPNLRFPEFEGEWESLLFDDIATIKGGFAFDAKTLSSERRKYQIVKMGNLYQNQLNLDRTPSFIDIIDNRQCSFLLKKNDIAITLTGTNNKRDYGYSYLFKSEDNLLLNQRCALIRAKYDSHFLSYLIKTRCFLEQFFQSSAGGTGNQANVSTKNIEIFIISVPKRKEQEKIGKFLSLIDERIETQNKIIEKYESLIKGISDLLLYSKSDSLISAHLGSLCSIKKGEQVNVIELTDTDSYYVMNGGILPSGYYPNYNTSADTISISEGGNSCGYVQYNSSKFWSGGHCYTLNKINKQIFNKYLYYYLKSQEKNIQALRVGSGLPNIQKKDLERLEIQFPNYEEQEKIVNILTLFPRKIEIEYSLLSVFQKQKEYLLQQMFI